MLAYFIAALSPNMDVANAALPTYVVVRALPVGSARAASVGTRLPRQRAPFSAWKAAASNGTGR